MKYKNKEYITIIILTINIIRKGGKGEKVCKTKLLLFYYEGDLEGNQI